MGSYPMPPPCGHLSIALLLVVVFLHATAAPATASGADLAVLPCAATSSSLPATVSVPDDLQRHVASMLSLSATFRAQCRRIAEARGLRVLIRIDPGLGDRNYRARTFIHRAVDGGLLAVVQVSVRLDPVHWLAHEMEHIVEQLEGLRLPELAAVNKGAWKSADNMFETRRAIEAGRAVVEEMARGRRRYDGHKFVE